MSPLRGMDALAMAGFALLALVPLLALLFGVWWSSRARRVDRAAERIADALEVRCVEGRGPAPDLRATVEPLLEGLSDDDRPGALTRAAARLAERALEAREEEEEAALDAVERDPGSDLRDHLERFWPATKARLESIVGLCRQALAEAPDDAPGRVAVVEVLARVERGDEVLDCLPDRDEEASFSPAQLGRFAQAAAAVGDAAQAERLFRSALRGAPGDLGYAIGLGSALLQLDRPGEAEVLLRPALDEMLRRAGQIEGAQTWSPEGVENVSALLDEAVRRSSTAERVIEAHAEAGNLDPRAGVNYRLMGHSLLVRTLEEGKAPRRILVPTQEELRAGADRSAVHRHEDEGLHRLRERDLVGAEEAFRRALDLDPQAWPALMGLGTTLEAHKQPWIWRAGARDPFRIPGIESLVDPWRALTPDERRLLELVLGPIAPAVPGLVSAGGRLHVVSLDARCTDLPTFADARGVLVERSEDRRTHDAIDGMAQGPVCAARIETLYQADPGGLTVAHELGHALHAILSPPICEVIEAGWEHACQHGWTASEYGLTNPEEFFATGFERFVLREAFPDAPRDELHEDDLKSGRDDFYRGLARLIALPAPSA